jgi:hypothetical protein
MKGGSMKMRLNWGRMALIALLAVGTMAAIPLGITTIICDGTSGGGTGGQIHCNSRQYAYRVKPRNPVTQVEIGTEDGNIAHYSGICAPPGWTMTIVPVQRRHDWPYTAHGNFTGSMGKCQYLVRWTGPAMTTNFEVGFNQPWDPHDTHWKTSDGSTAQWGFPVGGGPGPVHGPAFP